MIRWRNNRLCVILAGVIRWRNNRLCVILAGLIIERLHISRSVFKWFFNVFFYSNFWNLWITWCKSMWVKLLLRFCWINKVIMTSCSDKVLSLVKRVFLALLMLFYPRFLSFMNNWFFFMSLHFYQWMRFTSFLFFNFFDFLHLCDNRLFLVRSHFQIFFKVFEMLF